MGNSIIAYMLSNWLYGDGNFKTTYSQKDYLIMILGIGGILFILFTLISWIVYYVSKKRNAKDPMKIALIVFSFLVFAGIAGNSSKFSMALREKNRYEFMQGYRESLYSGFDEKFKSHPEVPKEIVAHSHEISDCIYDKVNADNSLVDKLMTVDDPKGFVVNSPEMKQIVSDCMMVYLEPLSK
jgi:hypothetical protein